MLHIVQDGQKDDDDDGDGIPSQTGANVSFRSIIDHLCSCHSMSLRILDMKNAYVDVKSLKKLFTSCKVVEEVYLCTGRHVLVCQIFTFVTCERGIYFHVGGPLYRRFSRSTVHHLYNSIPHSSTSRTPG